MKTVSIIGFGRFGKTLLNLLEGDFKIVLYDADPQAFKKGSRLGKGVHRAKDLREALQSEVIFYAVPIAKFEQVIRSHAKFLKPHQLVVDVLSVKMHPAQVLKKVLAGRKVPAILTHPMFGPDSARDGFRGLPLVMSKFTAGSKDYAFWKNYFIRKGLRVVELTPAEHDRQAAVSQGVAHFVGRLLESAKFGRTAIDTSGARRLHELREQISRDSRELFRNLQNFNPYTKDMRLKIGRSYDTLYNQLLPARVKKGTTVIGIQGGRGSFNEQAILEYVKKKKIRKFEIKYLYTSERVLRTLHEGGVDFGLFAIQNAVGGMVQESVVALSRYKCTIMAEFPVLVRHFLMKRQDNPLRSPKVIMAHDQVFRQCAATLRKKYPAAKLKTGQGDLQDTARAARALARGALPQTVFILGPRRLAELYDLEIVARDLQDNPKNFTTFLLVQR